MRFLVVTESGYEAGTFSLQEAAESWAADVYTTRGIKCKVIPCV